MFPKKAFIADCENLLASRGAVLAFAGVNGYGRTSARVLDTPGLYIAAGDTPESVEHVSLDTEQWQTLAPRICKDIADTQQAFLGDSEAQAVALGKEWLGLIWPPGTTRAEYWFTV